MAKKKGMGRLRGARTATKKQERELIERAKRMRKDPKIVIHLFRTAEKT